MNKISCFYSIQFSLLLCLILIFSVAVPVEADHEEEHNHSSERSEPIESIGNTDGNYSENVEYESPRSEELEADPVKTDHQPEKDDPVPFTGEQQPLIISLAELSPTMQKIDDYWIIETFAQLNEVREALSDKYRLLNDIEIPENTNWNPIGQYHNNPFSGTFDGSGFAISGLVIDKDLPYAGFFGYVKNAEIIDLHLRDIDINAGSGSYVGGIAGWADDVCFFENCSVQGIITGKGNSMGGLVGYAKESIINNCFADCDIIGLSNSTYNGGLIGTVRQESKINNCYSLGSVSGKDHIGGLFGRVSGVTNSESLKNTITNCFTAAIVDSNGLNVGGFSGSNHPHTIINRCYWDKEASGQELSIIGIGKSTEEMKNEATYENWDFANTWFIEEGESYPILRWQLEGGPSNPDDLDESGGNPGESDGDGDEDGGAGETDSDDNNHPGGDDNNLPGNDSNDHHSEPTLLGNESSWMMSDQSAKFNSGDLFFKLLSMIRQLEKLLALMLETVDFRQANIHAEIDLLLAEIIELFETNRFRLSPTEEKIILDKLESLAAVLAAD
ncbi:MAG: hypothetical protein FJ152_00360 [Firmicutes bacterium]|nr:hypothetical protein [Bacillota bacterium]